jgi:outer membrane lipoprotein-sorting protein
MTINKFNITTVLCVLINIGLAKAVEQVADTNSKQETVLTSNDIANDPTLYKGAWTANKIAEITEDKYDGDTLTVDVTMVLISSRGDKRIRRMKSYRKDLGVNLKDNHLVSIFVEPADIRNTAFLNYEYDDEAKSEEAWLYLPALRKVKRLSPSDKSDAFMGSDFSYNDLKTNHREYWNYKIISESEIVDGEDCWVIEGNPRPEKAQQIKDETGYLKTQLWIQKKTFTKVRGKFWTIKGKKVKLYKAADIKRIDGVWFPHFQQMVTTKKGRVEHSTIFKYSNTVFNDEIDDSFFTPHGIESGL